MVIKWQQVIFRGKTTTDEVRGISQGWTNGHPSCDPRHKDDLDLLMFQSLSVDITAARVSF